MEWEYLKSTNVQAQVAAYPYYPNPNPNPFCGLSVFYLKSTEAF